MKSWTASEDSPASVSEETCRPPTRRITSPATPIGSRAVTRIVSPGQAESHLSVSSAQVGIRCSQLSRITRGLPDDRKSIKAESAEAARLS